MAVTAHLSERDATLLGRVAERYGQIGMGIRSFEDWIQFHLKRDLDVLALSTSPREQEGVRRGARSEFGRLCKTDPARGGEILTRYLTAGFTLVAISSEVGLSVTQVWTLGERLRKSGHLVLSWTRAARKNKVASREKEAERKSTFAQEPRGRLCPRGCRNLAADGRKHCRSCLDKQVIRQRGVRLKNKSKRAQMSDALKYTVDAMPKKKAAIIERSFR